MVLYNMLVLCDGAMTLGTKQFFFISHVGILGKYVLVLHFCIGETQIGETNGTNTELLKSPMQALLTRAAGVEKNMQNA